MLDDEKGDNKENKEEKKKEELNDEERTRCEVWTRVMGYHRPVSSFNIGKKGEFEERKFFKEDKCENKEEEKEEDK